MSLDVYLYSQELYEDECYHCGHIGMNQKKLYDANITHNLGTMAYHAGIYEALWRPEEIECVLAKDIIDKLKTGLDLLKSNPEKYKEYNSPNGWGMYEHFVPFVEKYLNACIEYPDAIIRISR